MDRSDRSWHRVDADLEVTTGLSNGAGAGGCFACACRTSALRVSVSIRRWRLGCVRRPIFARWECAILTNPREVSLSY